MLRTHHRILFTDAQNLDALPGESIDLVVTSPPYPMIEMWDDLFKGRDHRILEALEKGDANGGFELMHGKLDRVWEELYRVLRKGGVLCINIGDATRTIDDRFRLFSNHARILQSCMRIGFESLPLILWRKQTNSPTKFMGSGMLPSGAYVTLEHEYILILRKDGLRRFRTARERLVRRQSALFWEERNQWFSDLWDFKGTQQSLEQETSRDRSAAFPFELAYRLINMYSVRGDTILDPFLGTGTTLFAAMASCRNSIGVEIDPQFKRLISSRAERILPFLNHSIAERLEHHIAFVEDSSAKGRELKYRNVHYNFTVMSKQESELFISFVHGIEPSDDGSFTVTYHELPALTPP